jgi:hypothetical protein
MTRIKRNREELETALLERLDNIRDYINGYKQGKSGRIKDIAVNLRVLLLSKGSNKPLLIDLAHQKGIQLIVRRDIPPIKGRRPVLPLSEFLEEVGFMSNVPNLVTLRNIDIVKNFADQEAAHEDHAFSYTHERFKSRGLIVGGMSVDHRSLLGIASCILVAAQELETKILTERNNMP